jgi:hypothetical protein
MSVHKLSIVKSNALLRKLHIKLVQRMALVTLRPRLAPWRYQRGHRSLVENLMGKDTTKSIDNTYGLVLDVKNDEPQEIVDGMEETIELLLGGIEDRDTTVRYSSAKGIGRIANRLNFDMADQILDSILDKFQLNCLVSDAGINVAGVNDALWHGACLSLAEFIRRGLLLPEKLGSVLPWTLAALFFEQRRSSHSIGSNVRDSACYIFWSFARAYHREVLKPFANQIAIKLCVASISDREIQVRRAASAAFQENVGRHGLFPHGISITTTADYFSLGNLSNTYLQIALQISKFDEYKRDILIHYVNHSLVHWDRNMRILASKSIGLQCESFASGFITNSLLPDLIDSISTDDFASLDGHLLAIGEICMGLFKIGINIDQSLKNVFID